MKDFRITPWHWVSMGVQLVVLVAMVLLRQPVLALLIGAWLAVTGYSLWRQRDPWRGNLALSGWTLLPTDPAFAPPVRRGPGATRILNVLRGRVAGRDAVAWQERDGGTRHWFFAIPLASPPERSWAAWQADLPTAVRQAASLMDPSLQWETRGAWLVAQVDGMGPVRFRSWLNKEGIPLARLATTFDKDQLERVEDARLTMLVTEALQGRPALTWPKPPRHEDTSEPGPDSRWEVADFGIRSTVQDPDR